MTISLHGPRVDKPTSSSRSSLFTDTLRQKGQWATTKGLDFCNDKYTDCFSGEKRTAKGEIVLPLDTWFRLTCQRGCSARKCG